MTKAEYKAHIVANSHFTEELFDDSFEIVRCGDSWMVESRMGVLVEKLLSRRGE